MKWIHQVLIFPFKLLILIYQNTISPLFPSTCRYSPSCSQYAIEALNNHGLIKGLWLGVKRIARCHPWSKSGHDPVPPKKK
ncbi:MAG: membrane protein insertion efficiency factor YidD [Crocinitomicaceae bacterium]|nr:membrane protein insertion efficiency factor YidD [Crocinitomicaceae bacterium]